MTARRKHVTVYNPTDVPYPIGDGRSVGGRDRATVAPNDGIDKAIAARRLIDVTPTSKPKRSEEPAPPDKDDRVRSDGKSADESRREGEEA